RPTGGLRGRRQPLDLPVTSTPANDGVRRGKLKLQAVYLGKRFRLMTPQDRIAELETADADESAREQQLPPKAEAQPDHTGRGFCVSGRGALMRSVQSWSVPPRTRLPPLAVRMWVRQPRGSRR